MTQPSPSKAVKSGTPADIEQIATRFAGEYLAHDISCERLYKDVVALLVAERERCEALLQPWKRRDHLSLHCGEVTAQEFRTVVAVLITCQSAIRAAPPSGEATK
ncbi:hypothetical protein [Mesorhizobium sp. B263B2A]|uniref:hypothetical protein n=1 Tax=Mesorhizobium sp. B263B2A TaxID=2876669 RepID=UPI001CD1531C|nr:hypothetical protein [Mesorhizobium sp. B263B2A]MCA0032698.1 hypothetical protein [Mesorhizobium sp. B263B2A]